MKVRLILRTCLFVSCLLVLSACPQNNDNGQRDVKPESLSLDEIERRLNGQPEEEGDTEEALADEDEIQIEEEEEDIGAFGFDDPVVPTISPKVTPFPQPPENIGKGGGTSRRGSGEQSFMDKIDGHKGSLF